ncbi:hypothetical protein ACSBR2_001253 [Camellia fascicularis]
MYHLLSISMRHGMAQELEMLAVEYESNALIVKVDTDDEYEFARDMQEITLIVLNGGASTNILLVYVPLGLRTGILKVERNRSKILLCSMSGGCQHCISSVQIQIMMQSEPKDSSQHR